MANTLKIKRGAAATIPQGQLAEPLFTTDTYDLYIGKGSGGNQRFQKYIASGTNSQFLKGDGSLDSTSYEPLITAGTTLQYWRGDKSFQTLDTNVVPENGPIYFTEPRVRATVLTGLNLTGGGTIAATDSILQAFGKVQNQISALVGSVYYAGTWNASTNSPTLASGTGTKGYYYIVTTAGSTNLDGITDWKIGDWAIFNGTTWDKVDNTDAVSSVNGFTGAVNLALDNISDVSAASPTNAQLLRFNGTSSLWENWTPTFEPALTKGNLTSSDTGLLFLTNGTGAVIGTGTNITVVPSGIVSSGLVLTTTGSSGAATKTTNTLNIPNYTLSGLGGVPTTRTLTINGTAYDLSADRSWSVGTVTGTGTTGTIPKWSSSSALNDSVITQSGSDILIGGTADQGKLQIDGTAAGGVMLNCVNTQFGFTIKNTSSSNKKWDFSPFNNNLYINESGVATRMAFIAGGNVAINDTAAGLRLTIVGTEGNPATTGTSQNGSLRFGGGDFVLDMGNSIGDGTAAQYTAWLQATSKAALGTNYKISLNPNGGNVGINKLNPSVALDVSGAGSFSSSVTAGQMNVSAPATTTYGSLNATTNAYAYQEYKYNNTTYGYIGQHSAFIGGASSTDLAIISVNNLIFGTSGSFTERLRISSTGAATFSSSVTAGDYISASAIGASYYGLRVLGTSGGARSIFLAGQAGYSNGFTVDYTGTTMKYVFLDGNVGIGTSSQSVLLHLAKASAANQLWLESTTGTNPAYMNFKNTGGNNFIGVDNSAGTGLFATGGAAYGFGMVTESAYPLLFGTNNIERMRITSGGNVGIACTPNYGRLEIQGATTDKRLYVGTAAFYSNSIDILGISSIGGEIPVGIAGSELQFWTNATKRMTITNGGNIEATGSIKTGNPTSGTAKPWKLGSRIVGTCTTSTTAYLEVDVDGTLYYLAFANPS
jgi:hypothetical protein